MKLGVFTTKEELVNWYTNEIEAIRNNGLKLAREMYEAALKGEGKESWMKFNNTTDEAVWIHHLRWLKNQVKYHERKIKKYEREIAKNS